LEQKFPKMGMGGLAEGESNFLSFQCPKDMSFVLLENIGLIGLLADHPLLRPPGQGWNSPGPASPEKPISLPLFRLLKAMRKLLRLRCNGSR
jgi:hypothetical protein